MNPSAGQKGSGPPMSDQRRKDELSARRLIEVLELAEALPFTFSAKLDRPKRGAAEAGRLLR